MPPFADSFHNWRKNLHSLKPQGSKEVETFLLIKNAKDIAGCCGEGKGVGHGGGLLQMNGP